MLRLRHQRRIQPARTHRSGRRIALTAVLGLVVTAWLVTTVASRDAQRTIDLDPAGAYRVVSTAGPLELTAGAGDEARLDYRASWLLRGPALTTGPRVATGPEPAIGVAVECPTRWPCRASARLELPMAVGLEAISTGGPLTIGRFDGRIRASTEGDHDLLLGPTAGIVSAETEGGDVIGSGLAAHEVEVRTDRGAVHLVFAERPQRVSIVAGDEPVTVELPPGRYAVTVVGSSSATIDVPRDESADSRISIDGRGPVRITPAT